MSKKDVWQNLNLIIEMFFWLIMSAIKKNNKTKQKQKQKNKKNRIIYHFFVIDFVISRPRQNMNLVNKYPLVGENMS